MVSRHPTCCTAEDIGFSVTLSLSIAPRSSSFLCCLDHFLRTWYAALREVLTQVQEAIKLLPVLLPCREVVQQEEFIPILPPKTATSEKTSSEAGAKGKVEVEGERRSVHQGISTAQCSENRAGEDDEKPPLEMDSSTNNTPNKNNKDTELDNENRGLDAVDGDGDDDPPVPRGDQSGEEEQRYRYRAPLHLFPRLFNMNTRREQRFWQQVHRHREYLATHAPVMSPINVFFNCLPYDPHACTSPPPQPQQRDREKDLDVRTEETDEMENDQVSDEVLSSGWVRHQPEEDCDVAVLTPGTLRSSSLFLEWLEDLVAQSSLQREIIRVLQEAGIDYVERDPLLPLEHFLSFVQVFCAAGAVRSVLEGQRSLHTKSHEDNGVGLTVIVGLQCDVRDGGRLFIPWYMDPTVLITLLDGEGGEEGYSRSGVVLLES